MHERGDQERRLADLLRTINVPADGALPAIELVFMGPVERIASHWYDQGLRVIDSE